MQLPCAFSVMKHRSLKSFSLFMFLPSIFFSYFLFLPLLPRVNWKGYIGSLGQESIFCVYIFPLYLQWFQRLECSLSKKTAFIFLKLFSLFSVTHSLPLASFHLGAAEESLFHLLRCSTDHTPQASHCHLLYSTVGVPQFLHQGIKDSLRVTMSSHLDTEVSKHRPQDDYKLFICLPITNLAPSLCCCDALLLS